MPGHVLPAALQTSPVFGLGCRPAHGARFASLVTLAATAALTLCLSSNPRPARAEAYTHVATWGNVGSGPGEFSWPTGLAVDESSKVYVADQNNFRIEKFSGTGAYLDEWGTANPGCAYALGYHQGTLYLTDVCWDQVFAFDTSGVPLGGWGDHGLDEGQFTWPVYAGADTSGNIYVGESSGRIQKFTSSGQFLLQWAPCEVVPPLCGSVYGLAVSDSSRVFVTVTAAPDGNVLIFDEQGGFLSAFSAPPSGPLAVDRFENVYLARAAPPNSFVISKYSRSGAFLTDVSPPGGLPGSVSALAVDDSGSVFALDNSASRVFKFSPTPPILLVHGLCGDSTDWNAFKGVLRSRGHSVYADLNLTPPNARPADLVDEFAERLHDIEAPSVTVIAHSMGGLVAREYIRRQALAGEPSQIGTLVTIGTPHHGSHAASWLFGHPALKGLLELTLFRESDCALSAPAFFDLLPGSTFLNELNYPYLSLEGCVGSDAFCGNSWDTHEVECLGDVKIVTIAGTAPLQLPFGQLTSGAWTQRSGLASLTVDNDGLVGASSAYLTNATVVRWTDTAAGIAPLGHSLKGYPFAPQSELGSTELANFVADLLADGAASALRSTADQKLAPPDVTSDTLMVERPSPSGAIGAGEVRDYAFFVPATQEMQVVQSVSQDVRLLLVDPLGQVIAPSDTATLSGVSYFETSALEAFSIHDPSPGTWKLRTDASSSPSSQDYSTAIEYLSTGTVRIQLDKTTYGAGEVVHVVLSVTDAGAPIAGTTWSCETVDPSGASASFTVFDDGKHVDGTAADGVFGETLTPTGPQGIWAIHCNAVLPNGAEITGGTAFDVGTGPVSVDADVSAAPRVGAWPNPALEKTVVRLSIPESGPAALDVFDVAGRRVYAWDWANLQAGTHSVEWDGRTLDGQQRVGVFFLRLRMAGQFSQRKIVIVR